MQKQRWIYFLRGLGIGAVVVCHQQNLLHSSDVIQALTLYSVTSLVFLMGVTKTYSIQSFILKRRNEKILTYYFSSVTPILLSYFVASFCYCTVLKGINEWGRFLTR